MQDLAILDRLDEHLATITDPAEAAQLTKDIRALRTAAGRRSATNHLLVKYAKAARHAGRLLAQVERSPGRRTDTTSLHDVTRFQQALAECDIDVATAHRWQGLARIEIEAFNEWCERVQAGVDRASVALIRPSATPGTRVLAPLPVGEFRVLYVDPPWRYDYAEAPNREVENQYYTLDLEELSELTDVEGRHVRELAAADAVLFMWATSPKLEDAIKLIARWNFDYRTSMVWVKDKIGMGYYARQRHEFLLIAKRGEPPMPEPSNRPDSVITAPRTEHSAKPEMVYELIEIMFEGPYVELFARTERPGWERWGTGGDI